MGTILTEQFPFHSLDTVVSKQRQVTVYDRWGQKVFNVVGYTTDKRWDGTNRGLKLPTSTYYYVIDLNTDGDTDAYVGYVTIIH